MIKTNDLNLVINCEDCEELAVTDNEVLSSVPLRDTDSGESYSMEFAVKNSNQTGKSIELRHLYDGTKTDCLETLDSSTKTRLRSLIQRILDGGVCGNLPQCPDAICSMGPDTN